MKKIIICCVLAAVSTANGQESSQEKFLQSRIEKVDSQIPQKQEKLNDLRKELALKKKKLSDIRSEISVVDQDIEKVTNELSRSLSKLSIASKRLDVIHHELATAETQRDAVQSNIAKSSIRKQQSREQLANDLAINESSADTAAITAAPAVSNSSSAVMGSGYGVAAEPNVESPTAPPGESVDMASESVDNIAIGVPAEKNDGVVLAKDTESKRGEAANELEVDEDGIVVESAKAGGEFVKEETKSVVKSAAKSAVRKGIKSVLGL